MSQSSLIEPPRAPPSRYGRNTTRWEKEKAAAGGPRAFDHPEDPPRVGPWVLGDTVGKGASGRVRLVKHKYTGQIAACKILSAKDLAASRVSLDAMAAKFEKQRLGIDREIVMMKLMDHPNIMHMYDVWEGEKDLYLILEYVEGGELFDYLVNRGRLQIVEALKYFKQIVNGLQYCHSFGIVHRDLKPENILLCGPNQSQVKIADWGMATLQLPTNQLETSCGSPHYASPEIVNGDRYEGPPSDIWSCGVILFALLTGRLPFDDKNIRMLLDKVRVGKYSIPSYVDDRAKDLITRMLVVDTTKRITISEILEHPFMKVATPGLVLAPRPTFEELSLEHPLTMETLDMDIVMNVQVLWRKHSQDHVKEELVSPEKNLAKVFYFLIMRYRDRQMESFNLNGECGGTVRPYSAPYTTRAMQRPAPPPPIGSPEKRSATGKASPRKGPAPHRVSRISTVASPSRVKPLPPRPGSQGGPKQITSPVFAVPAPPQIPRIQVDVVGTAQSDLDASPLQSPRGQGFKGSTAQTAPALDCIVPPSVEHPALRKAVHSMADAVNKLVVEHNAKQEQVLDKAVSVWISGARSQDKENAPLGAPPNAPFRHAPSLPKDGAPQRMSFHASEIKTGRQSLSEQSANLGDRRKSRPAPLDLTRTSVEHKRPVQNGSLDTSSVIAPLLSPLPSPIIISPVNEVRGWFTNLFNWKAQTYVLHSFDNCLKTRDEMARVVERFGVIGVLEDAEGWGTLRCKYEETSGDRESDMVNKSVRFRVEFAPLINSRTSAPDGLDKIPPVSAGSYVSTATMVLERGANSSFKLIYNRVKAVWRLDLHPLPFSPLEPRTPTIYENDDVFAT